MFFTFRFFIEDTQLLSCSRLGSVHSPLQTSTCLASSSFSTHRSSQLQCHGVAAVISKQSIFSSLPVAFMWLPDRWRGLVERGCRRTSICCWKAISQEDASGG
ncbi:UNVERIFIED_CONTAM: hypothetical protein FKN15_068292 [Acipenser sinensis]